ncbi:MAG: hypothetical protein ACRDKG_12125 [Actinomycetota bacterium]
MSELTTTYIQAAIFAILGVRCIMAYFRERDERSRDLAWAAGLFGLSSLISAVSNTIWDQAQLETPPRAISIVSMILIFVSVYAFLRFLMDFIPFPKWVHAFMVVATGVNIVLGIVERPDLRFDPERGLVPIPGVDNPISYRGFLGYILIYLAIAFGVLALSFAVYGFRSAGLARFRMLMIASGFFLLFAVIGFIPRLLFGNPSAETIRTIGNVARYVALLAAPLLLVGFSPPGWVRNLIGRADRPHVPLDRKVQGAA